MERCPRADTHRKGNPKTASAAGGSRRWEGEPLEQAYELAAPRLSPTAARAAKAQEESRIPAEEVSGGRRGCTGPVAPEFDLKIPPSARPSFKALKTLRPRPQLPAD